MRITKIKGVHISIPLAVPYKLSRVYGTASDAHAVVVIVETDGGITGYGEADPHPPFTRDTVDGTVSAIRGTLAPALIGCDPREIPAAENLMDDVLDGHLMAKGALDMALHDISGKSYGVPVHEMLGEKVRDSILLSFPLGSGTAEEDSRIIEERKKHGFRSFMAKMGRNSIKDEIIRVRNLSDNYGGDIHLVADANQGWREEDALDFVRGVAGSFLSLLEQPVPADQLDSLRRIRLESSVPLSADESVVSEQDAKMLIEKSAVDVFSVKASKNGGISKARRIAMMAEGAGIDCRMNSMLEFGVTQAALLHIGAVAKRLIPSGHAYMSTLRMADDFTNFKCNLGDGFARVIDLPGLGVRIDADKLAKYRRAGFSV